MRKIALLSVLVLALVAVLSIPAPNAEASGWILVCEPGFNGAFCEVQGAPAGSTYAWNTSGHAYIPQPCSGPFCQIGCWGSGSGWPRPSVTVTVTSGGSSSSQTRGIGCSSW